ncbi:MAG: hypothetical protein PVI90_00245 [Desulfobacteraceae bacterium]|jgi:hypothetical protein
MQYCLTWQKNTPLDLSQILDTRGRPVVFIGKGANVTVDAITYKHPLIQKYLKCGLSARTNLPVTKEPPAVKETPITIINSPIIEETPVTIKTFTAEHNPPKTVSPPKKLYRSKRIKHT